VLQALGSVIPSLLIAIAIASGLQAQPNNPTLVVRETSLGVRPAGIVPYTIEISPAMRIAYVVESASGDAVVVDGVRGPTYQSIANRHLTEAGRQRSIFFSYDGSRVAYRARKAGGEVAVVDHKEGPLFESIVFTGPFSADSRHVGYMGRRDGKWIMVVDSVESPPYDMVSTPAFTKDGRRIGYTARRGERASLLVDGKRIAESDYIYGPIFSDDGSRYAYVTKNGDKWSVVVDGMAGTGYRSIGNHLLFSGDGRRFLYLARDSLDYVVVDGVQSRGFPFIYENSYALSANGLHYAFIAGDGEKMFWVLDGKWLPRHDRVGMLYPPAFNSDGTRLTYSAKDGDSSFVVIGGWASPTFSSIQVQPMFWHGKVLYVANRGREQIIGVDSATFAFDSVASARVLRGGRVMISARNAQVWRVIVNGATSEPYDKPVEYFLVDSAEQRVAYRAEHGGQRFVVVDGERSPSPWERR
jgi:hypothetical protein